jgi:hypothetical protein
VRVVLPHDHPTACDACLHALLNPQSARDRWTRIQPVLLPSPLVLDQLQLRG